MTLDLQMSVIWIVG